MTILCDLFNGGDIKASFVNDSRQTLLLNVTFPACKDIIRCSMCVNFYYKRSETSYGFILQAIAGLGCQKHKKRHRLSQANKKGRFNKRKQHPINSHPIVLMLSQFRDASLDSCLLCTATARSKKKNAGNVEVKANKQQQQHSIEFN